MKYISAFLFIILFYSCDELTSNVRIIPKIRNIDNQTQEQDPPICNPFGGNGQLGSIKATLYEGDESVEEFSDFELIDKIVSNEIYLSSMEVPRISWDSGFGTKDGKILKGSNGEVLNEWFGLKLQSSIQLRDDQKEGYYTFRSFSDDGFKLSMMINNRMVKIIDTDEIDPPRFHCFTTRNGEKVRAIRMTRNTKLRMEALYFQGPRFYIALTLQMRRVARLNRSDRPYFEYRMDDDDCDDKNYKNLKPENYYLDGAPLCQ